MINYFYDCYRILYKVYSEGTYIQQALSDTDIEELNRALTVKTCYGVLDKDITLSYRLGVLAPKSPKLPIRIILKIAMYAVTYLKKPIYAVTDNAVAFAKKLGKGGASGFVNGFLRQYAATEFILPKDKNEALSIKYSYPLFAVNILVADYGEQEAEIIISYDEENSSLVFFNGNGAEYLSGINAQYEETPIKNCFFVKRFRMNDDFRRGVYTFQSVGSAAICDVVKSGGGDYLYDACAAPGGKSVNLASSFAHVDSTDIYPHRVELIKDYAARMNISNIEATVGDASVLCESRIEKYDAVLCDVPCSGFGVIKENPDIKLRREFASLDELNALQLKIIENCAKYVKKGGYLYYSTCSVFKRENDGVVEEFLSRNKDFTVAEADSPLTNEKTLYGLQFLPHVSSGAGFYVAKLVKRS